MLRRWVKTWPLLWLSDIEKPHDIKKCTTPEPQNPKASQRPKEEQSTASRRSETSVVYSSKGVISECLGWRRIWGPLDLQSLTKVSWKCSIPRKKTQSKMRSIYERKTSVVSELGQEVPGHLKRDHSSRKHYLASQLEKRKPSPVRGDRGLT